MEVDNKGKRKAIDDHISDDDSDDDEDSLARKNSKLGYASKPAKDAGTR
jgi:hypothetical protein